LSDLVVDIHAHYVPNLVFQRFAAHQTDFPGVRMFEENAANGARAIRFQFPGGEPTRPVLAALSELTERKQAMDAEGIDHAILSLWTDLEGYELDPAEGAAWSRFINACLLEELAAEERFTPLASVPLQDGARAAAVLEEALAQGFAGAMIGTLPHGARGGNLDDPSLDPFWEAASRLGAAIYLHPMFLCNEPRLADYDLINTVGRLADTSIAIGRLLASGHLLKFSGMNLILSHGGAALPYALGRFRRTYEAAGKKYGDPQAGFERLYYDSCVYDAAALEFLVARAGAAKVMLGSDAPMSIAEMHPVALIAAARLQAGERTAILGGNAKRVFRLRPGCSC
jgi:aminocarboxymuconate-semialdehyde decarboxylase